MRGDAVRNVRPALLALFAGAIMVLLISCVNVANLLLSHAGARRREIAVRLALGASHWRIIRQLLSESLLLCSLGGVLGLVIGLWSVSALLGIRPESLSSIGSIHLNWPVLGFIASLSLLSGLLFGLAPALEARKIDLTESLKQSGRAGHGKMRLRKVLVIGEVALGLVLLIGAGLMTRTLAQIQKVDPGFRTDRTLSFELNLSGRNYSTDQKRALFVEQWEEKLRFLNGVEAVGAVSHLPLDDYPNWYSPYAREGLTEDQKKNLLADYRCVTPGYFQAIGAKLLVGRYFNNFDRAESGNVVIIDDLLAHQTWPNDTAIGKRLEVERFVEGGFEPAQAEVVGVIEHIRHHSLTKQLRGQIYIPFTQSARPHLSYVIKTTDEPLALVSAIRRELKGMDSKLAISKVRPLQEYVERDMASADFTAILATIFGLLALALAALGIYGVLSYAVVQRLREIGVRMALGAQRRDILLMVIRQGLMTTLIGVGIGLIASFWVTRLLSNLLFGVTAYDPQTFITVPVLLCFVALLACYIPARRATKVDPLEVLRHE